MVSIIMFFTDTMNLINDEIFHAAISLYSYISVEVKFPRVKLKCENLNLEGADSFLKSFQNHR